jgi:hypothetical protein
MRLCHFIACALLAAAPLLSAAPADQPVASGIDASAPANAIKNDPLLPPAIAGYELRTLDVRKPILFNANGKWVRVDLPVFFYFPKPMPPQAAPILRRIYNELLKLARQPEWTAAELQGVIVNLDAAIRLLEQPAASEKIQN